MSDSAASEFVAPASLARRLPRALRRRLASYWSSLTHRRRPTAEAAFESLLRAFTPTAAEPGRQSSTSVTTLGQAIATAARFGELRVAIGWSRTLLAMQSADGSFGDGRFADGRAHPSRFHTAQALRGLLGLHAALNKRAAGDAVAPRAPARSGRPRA